MKTFPFKKIDAFTGGASGGNPCACVYLNDASDITPAQMQKIAAELKGFVNEVVFLFPEDGCWRLKYYSAECEVDFCGHGTIGIMYDLIMSHPDLLDKDVVPIRVKDEYLEVYNRILDQDCVYITAPAPVFRDVLIEDGVIARALNITEKDMDHRFDPAFINAGLNTLIFPVCKLDVCLSMLPDEKPLAQFCLKNGLDIILVFTGDVADSRREYRTRVFAPRFGYLEDPATGSGSAAFGYYLLKRRLWDGDIISLEQNGSRDCPNIVRLGTVQQGRETRVIFGGAADVKIKGVYMLPGAG
ncbi:MAG: PhzF family phenazine biosynthesis protein [Deltaproteobacteria bacterium]